MKPISGFKIEAQIWLHFRPPNGPTEQANAVWQWYNCCVAMVQLPLSGRMLAPLAAGVAKSLRLQVVPQTDRPTEGLEPRGLSCCPDSSVDRLCISADMTDGLQVSV